MMRVLGVGAGGHAKVVLSILWAMGGYEVVGLLDPDHKLWGTRVANAKVLGDDDLLPDLLSQGINYAFIGVGTLGNTKLRCCLYKHVKHLGFAVVSALHPRAIVDPTVTLGDGPTVAAGAIINVDACLGDNVLVNTGAIVEHDCVLEDHVHIAPGARLAGGVQVGEGTHIGLGACVRQSLRIGHHVVVGAGAVVVRDVPDNVVVVGVPARILRKIT